MIIENKKEKSSHPADGAHGPDQFSPCSCWSNVPVAWDLSTGLVLAWDLGTGLVLAWDLSTGLVLACNLSTELVLAAFDSNKELVLDQGRFDTPCVTILM